MNIPATILEQNLIEVTEDTITKLECILRKSKGNLKDLNIFT